MPAFFQRVNAGLQDMITVALYLTAWIAPTVIGVAQVRGLLAAIVIEFLVLHASLFYAAGIRKREDRQARRIVILAIITAIYLVPIVAISLKLKSFAPALSFVWLFTARFAFIWMHPTTATAETERMGILWAVSLGAFFLGTILVSKIPLPPLGMTHAFLAQLSLSGHPNPNAQPPQVSIVFGAIYFSIMACAKIVLAGRGATKLADGAQRPELLDSKRNDA